jgi:RNA polymerase sigma factor (sigma-70 family)
MVTDQTSRVIQHLRHAALLRDGAGLSDGQLLGCFVERRDEAAFAALVKRHGPMVWGVCHRLLNPQDAEDAFQATFLVLVRKAATVLPREMVGNWLYGVAHQTVLHARRTAARRKGRERQVANMPEPAVTDEDRWPDLQPLLDEELSRLPHNYRAVIVLCDLEGKTRKEVARQLGVPDGSVAGWLARARAMLAKRLTHRGVALSGGALAAVLAQQAVSAGVPDSVVDSTIKAASLSAAGKAARAGAISAKVAALTEGVVKAMLFTKLKAVSAVVLILGIVATGTTFLASRTAAGQEGRQPVAEKPVKPAAKPGKEKDKEIVTAWGKEVGGLQAGLGFRPGQKRVYRPGETVTLVVRVRNVGHLGDEDEAVKFQYLRQSFMEQAPTVTDGAGKRVHFRYGWIDTAIFHIPVDVNLAPGKEIELGEVKLSTALFGTGQFSLQYEKVLGNSSSGRIKLNPRLTGLATGKLELEVKAAPPPPEKKEPRKQEGEEQGFTAWGKEVGGLQAGLGFRPGKKRVYRHGEAVTVVLRIRNVGKEAVEFKHIWAFFVENPPTITDADGKKVQLPRFTAEGRHLPRSTRVVPGNEAVLYEWSLDLRPKGERNPSNITIHGTGKFSLQCERIVGPTSANPNHPNPTLDKLATGKLELDVKSAPPPGASRFPAGWGGGGGKDYELSVDKTVRHGGKASGSIKSIVPTPLWYGALTQAFRADRFRGQRLRMTAYVKSRDVENSAVLWMRIEGFDGKGNYSLSSDYMGGRPIKGTTDWKQYAVVLDVPKEGAAQISFGVLLAGKGQVWVDDFKFEAVGNAVKTTGKAREPGKAAVGLAKGLPREPKNLDFEQ